MPVDALRADLAGIEAGAFTSLTDEDLQERIRSIHVGFRFTAPIFHPGTLIFRAVRVAEKPLLKARISYPPADRVRVNGRMNRAGETMFYGSLGNFASCLCECRCAAGESFAVSVWKTTKLLTMNHLGYSREAIDAVKARRALPSWTEQSGDTERNALIRAWQVRVFTRVVPDGEEHLYRLGIALRNWALGHMVQIDPSVPDFFAGITYPAVSMWLLGDNVALLPSVVDSSLDLQEVIYLKVESVIESPQKDGGKQWSYNLRVRDVARCIRPGDRLIWNQESTALSVSPWQINTTTFR